MKRWHEDFPRTYREWKKRYLNHVEGNLRYCKTPGQDPCEVNICDKQIGRFRKTDAYDCGHARCFMCHSDKFPVREKTRKELRSELKFKEQLEEL
jgi:hypothetical protein